MGNKQIAVVGAGILGSSIAVELAASGHSVEIFSSGSKEQAATSNTFGWINAHTPQNSHHFEMRLESMRLWRETKAAHPRLPARAVSGIDWDMPQSELERLHQRYNEQGHLTEYMNASTLKENFPGLNFPKINAIVSSADMVAEPDLIADFFHSLAEALGAKTSTKKHVNDISPEGNSVELSSGSEKRVFDHVVIAAGIGSQNLVEQLGYALPMNNQEGALFRSPPQEKRMKHLINAPDLHCWQLQDGSIIAGSAQAGSDPNDNPEKLREQLATRLGDIIPEFKGIEFPIKTVGTRPQPADGLPVIDLVGEHKNIHLAVMHSGITLAPFVAKAIAHQVEAGMQHSNVAPYSLARFQTNHEKIAV